MILRLQATVSYAVRLELIPSNPTDKVDRPKKDRYIGSFYDADELTKLFKASKGTKLEFPILFGAFYGMRRSEVLGLKWDAIDFENDTIVIRHTVTSANPDGHSLPLPFESRMHITKSPCRMARAFAMAERVGFDLHCGAGRVAALTVPRTVIHSRSRSNPGCI